MSQSDKVCSCDVSRLSVDIQTMHHRPLPRFMLAALGIAIMVNATLGEKVDFESLGFTSKEADVLKKLGAQTTEDLEFLREEDLAKAPEFSIVETRRLQYKVSKTNAISRIRRLDAEGIVQEMKPFKLDPAVQMEGGKALARRITQAVKSTTKLEKIAKDDGATDALTRAIDMHDENTEVVANAVNAMSMLAMTEESKITIGAEGGLDAVLVALRTHRNNVTVMLPAIKLLARIAINDKIKKIIATEEIFEVILSTIATHQNASEYTDMACLALWQMTGASSAPTLGICHSICCSPSHSRRVSSACLVPLRFARCFLHHRDLPAEHVAMWQTMCMLCPNEYCAHMLLCSPTTSTVCTWRLLAGSRTRWRSSLDTAVKMF